MSLLTGPRLEEVRSVLAARAFPTALSSPRLGQVGCRPGLWRAGARRGSVPGLADVKRWAEQHGVLLLGSAGMCVLVLYESARWGWDLSRWDWLLVSGVAVFLVAYGLSRGFPRRVRETVQRLWDRGVIGPGPAARPPGREVARVMTALEGTAARYRLVGAPVAALLMVALWWAAFGGLPWRNGALWLDVVLAAVAGAVVGRLVAYGRLGRVLVRTGLPPRALPGHLDGAAGLSPVGGLYVAQASVVAAIGLFAGVWWLVIGEVDRYAYWRGPYVVVIVVAVGCELLAFFAPLWSFHRLMAAERRRLLTEADRASAVVRELTTSRALTHDPDEQERIDAEIAWHTRVWHDIETMPTWPVDPGVRRRFAWNNLVVAVPLALKLVAAPTWWQDLANGLAGFLT